MRILAVYRYYWPDTTPYARILRSMMEQFHQDGHQATVFTAQPGYNDIRQECQPWQENLDGVDVIRKRLLPEKKRRRILWFLNTAYFVLRAMIHVLFRRRYDVIISNTHPPIIMAAALWLLKRISGTEYVLHCMDIHPESALIGGSIGEGFLYRLLRRIDAVSCRSAKHVVVLSDDMVDTLAQRGLPHEKMRIINNPPLDRPVQHSEPLPPLLYHDVNAFRILFAGNIGRFQGLDLIIESAKLLRDHPQIRFIFMGEGLAKAELIRQSGDLFEKTVHFLPYQPVATACAAMQQSDLGIVSLLPDMYRYAYPSKTMTYLAAGCPILAVIEQKSELARTIRHYPLGYVARHRSAQSIADAVLAAWQQRNEWTPQRRDELKVICEQLFGYPRMFAAWHRLLETPARAIPANVDFTPQSKPTKQVKAAA